MKLWLKHLLVPYMPPYQGDLAELTGRFRPSTTFVAFIWPLGRTFYNSKIGGLSEQPGQSHRLIPPMFLCQQIRSDFH